VKGRAILVRVAIDLPKRAFNSEDSCPEFPFPFVEEANQTHQTTMTTKISSKAVVQPYLSFDGRCEEALEFYCKTLGAQIEMILRFKDSPEPCDPNMVPPGSENKVMHSSFRIGESVLMANDCGCSGSTPKVQGFSLSYSVPDAATVEKVFAALSEGGQVQMPLAKTFFSPLFGVVADRFGVSWMVLVTPSQS
jgi:PhnB protein